MEQKFYICKHCGNIIEKVEDKGVPVVCCGEVMQELQAGIEDGAVEKHVPVYTVEGDLVHVEVGEVGEKPAVDFKLCDNETVEEVYAYCNLHGLWKA